MRFLRLLFLLLLPLSVGAQVLSLDSLRRRLATTPADTNRVLLLNHLC